MERKGQMCRGRRGGGRQGRATLLGPSRDPRLGAVSEGLWLMSGEVV